MRSQKQVRHVGKIRCLKNAAAGKWKTYRRRLEARKAWLVTNTEYVVGCNLCFEIISSSQFTHVMRCKFLLNIRFLKLQYQMILQHFNN